MEITTFKDTKLHPQDIALVSNTIFVLDFYKGVYIYQYLNNKIEESFSIPLNSFGGNYQFTVYSPTMDQVSIFINFNDLDGSKVAELSVDLNKQTFMLVRFYKSGDFINKMKIFSVPTQFHLQPFSERYKEQYFDSFLFLLQN